MQEEERNSKRYRWSKNTDTNSNLNTITRRRTQNPTLVGTILSYKSSGAYGFIRHKDFPNNLYFKSTNGRWYKDQKVSFEWILVGNNYQAINVKPLKDEYIWNKEYIWFSQAKKEIYCFFFFFRLPPFEAFKSYLITRSKEIYCRVRKSSRISAIGE